MKKNVMMRVASALLVATLLSTCAISGTFAKYVESATGTDSARVAKWGVEITANGTTFAQTYDDAPTNAAAEVKADVKVVAPGTGGNMASMTLAGIPEVAVKVTYEATFELGDNWEVESAYYCPLIINVEGTPVNGASYASADEFEGAVEALINGWTKTYDAGTDLSTVATDSVSVSWEWPFYVSDDNDAKDTALGEAFDATISLTIKTTVTQVD